MHKQSVKNSFSSTTDELKYKIILVGNSSVGKSALFLKFTADSTSDAQQTKVTTIDFKLKQIILPQQPDSIKLYIWDTAGQERYRSIVSTYFKGCHGVLLVFDLHQPKSFQDVKNQWFPILKKKAQFSDIILVGNKRDLERRVETEQIQKFIKLNKLQYIETSVKLNENINEAFVKLTRIINHRRQQFQKPQSFYLKQKQIKHKKSCCLLN